MTLERRGHVLLIGLNRPEKRNAFNLALIDQLAGAYYELENDDAIRCGVLFGHGDHFTGGLDLAEVGPLVREGRLDEAFAGPGRRDPWRKDNAWTTPLVAAVQGWVMTLAIELLLAADVGIAASNARFAQLEIRRGIYPFGGATVRLPRDAGCGTDDRREVRAPGREDDPGVGPSRAHPRRGVSLRASGPRHGRAVRDRGRSRGAALLRRAT